jgi:hypothetical protein
MSNLAITAGDVVQSSAASKLNGKAGEAISAGEIVYLDGQPTVTNCRTETTQPSFPQSALLAIRQELGSRFKFVTKDENLTIGTHGLRLGIPMFLSATAGKVCPLADVSTGNQTTCVMVTNTSTTVSFGIIGGVGAHA